MQYVSLRLPVSSLHISLRPAVGSPITAALYIIMGTMGNHFDCQTFDWQGSGRGGANVSLGTSYQYHLVKSLT